MKELVVAACVVVAPAAEMMLSPGCSEPSSRDSYPYRTDMALSLPGTRGGLGEREHRFAELGFECLHEARAAHRRSRELLLEDDSWALAEEAR